MPCKLVLAAKTETDLKSSLRLATSFPALAKAEASKRGYRIASIQKFGGKVEGKLAGGNYDAIVDITESKKTIKVNNLEIKDVFIDPLRIGLVFRQKQPEPSIEMIDPWGLLSAINTIAERKDQLDAGEVPDRSFKNTLWLLNDDNKLSKTIGEESAELVRAIALNDSVYNEAADLIYAAMVAVTRSDSSAIKVFNELIRRNQC